MHTRQKLTKKGQTKKKKKKKTLTFMFHIIKYNINVKSIPTMKKFINLSRQNINSLPKYF
jgi:hypothetical protein